MTRPVSVARLETALAAAWDAPPAGLARIAAERRPPSTDMPKRLYANFDLYWLAGVLYAFRARLEDGSLVPSAFAVVLHDLVALAASRLPKWGLGDAGALLADVAEDVPRHAGDRDALGAIASAAIVYLNRLGSWVDATIPWSVLDEARPLPPPATGREGR